MNIFKDENWYTVYDKDGMYIKCCQDRDWAQVAAKQLNGRYIITKEFVEKPEREFELIDFRHNEFLRRCGEFIMITSLLLMLVSLIVLPFNYKYWFYHILAFIFFGVTTFFGMWFSSRYTQYYE